MTHDPINHPAHYTEGRRFETIEVIEDWELGFRLGNCVKYISRAGRKDPAKTIEDLKKGRRYLDREIAALEGEQTSHSATYEDVLDDAVEDAVNYGYTEADWNAYWDKFDSCNTLNLWDDSLGPVELTEEEIEEILKKKDLEQFRDDEIVTLIEKRGFTLGVKRDGSTCILGEKGVCE